ncbi:hypothetical protein [Iodobacter fluviatilis]|uniref:Uncharacterized protein n=1 Tax=Iodobacter fluviatilis TaxID=537 RepID=A0A377Q792_9NEIS|nr:hypothetical protein [Iodobacter fluviatilis]TCU89413.1 hypothetical protein EV682_102325 [Iodobacter fluviatilis]STQ90783.1 Uncharacterised protein [Iodobacter fluviatilis]
MIKSIAMLSTLLITPFCAAGSPIAEQATPKLAAEWWQWAMSTPRDESPVADLSGANCSKNQSGNTWFLAGGFGSSKIRRTCTIPAGKTLFFPLINMVYIPARGVKSITCEDTKAAAALNNDTALDLFAELDGKPVSNPRQYRISSKNCFDAFARQPASMQPYKAFPSATDGFWLLLKPLPPGPHTLKFGGKYNRESAGYGRMVQDIEYVLLVK